ncbi:MAG: hypothetical protein QM528_05965 [Phycisphaerales bacterium]|nr:hypothetical protein [Phycisphaerales bacterium]
MKQKSVKLGFNLKRAEIKNVVGATQIQNKLKDGGCCKDQTSCNSGFECALFVVCLQFASDNSCRSSDCVYNSVCP